jgi:two-component system, OmpR family, phosphate regulon sensor histidine kinase PhoR
MKNYSATHLAFLYSILIIGIVLIGIFVIDFIFNLDANWLNISIFIGLAFIISFVSLRVLLFKHINNRIKLIYKTINSRKKGKAAGSIKYDYNKDMISQVDRDMRNWADEQDREMTKIIEMSDYRKEFIGNVAHELKTPIFNIQGYTLTLLEGGLQDDNINEKYLKKIEKNINRMINIVNDLDAITRLESGQLSIRYKELDAVEICNEVIENLEEIIKDKQITTKLIKHYEGIKKVKADGELLRQVFSNLFLNAINYNKPGGKIKAEFFVMDDNLLIEVTDNGVGIPEEDLPRVFERFYRVDKSRSLNTGGTGLGLAIVKHIIEAHKQTVNVRSTVGVGTTIAFTLSKA